MSRSLLKSKRDDQVRPGISSVEERHVVGPVTDNTIFAILKEKVSLDELQIAISYLRGEGSELDCLGYPLTGQVGGLYEVVSADALSAGTEP